MENELIEIQSTLINGSYHPKPYTMFKIYEPKERNISSAAFRDRVVHHSIINILEPIFERRHIHDSYACRVGKGTHVALKRAQKMVRTYSYFLKCDIRKFFESIDHAVLIEMLQSLIKDEKLMKLLIRIIEHQPSYTMKGKGLPIGNLTSQHFANYYMGFLDSFAKRKLGSRGYVRYMDDFILFSNDKKELGNNLEKINEFVTEKLKMNLKEKITQIAPVTEGLPFLGHRIHRNLIRIQRPNLVRFRKKIHKMKRLYAVGEMKEEDLINSVRSMIAHASHGNTKELRRSIIFR